MTVNGKRLARVFPARTKYVPDDELAFTGPPDLFAPDVDEVHVSVVFTWLKEKAERLADQWKQVAEVKIGGPAYESSGIEFTPGLYVRHGYVMTSRGCPRNCYFCLVPQREGGLVELPIHEGPWIIDNNLLACSDGHVSKVFDMLSSQRDVRFLGGMDCHYLKEWHAERLHDLKSRVSYMYWAYDQPHDREPIARALEMLTDAGFRQQQLGCYVLCGYRGDTIEKAEERCEYVFVNGGIPFPMYYRGRDALAKKPSDWGAFCRQWTFPPFTISRIAKEGLKHFDRCIRGKLAT